MQKVCKTCGVKLDEYIYIFRPDRTQEIVAGIREEFPNIDFTITTIEGKKISIILRKLHLTEAQKMRMTDYFTDKGYIEDLEAESMDRS